MSLNSLEVLKLLAPRIRELGFKGSRQNFRKEDGDFIFILNFQGSPTGDCFYVNLGAQPVFVPAECYAEFKTLKEYECIMRRRIGKDWHWSMNENDVSELVEKIRVISGEFFGNAQTLRRSLVEDRVEDLLRKFSSGMTTTARTALHLARGALNLGLPEQANNIANHGLSLAGTKATKLIADLRNVIEECAKNGDQFVGS